MGYRYAIALLATLYVTGSVVKFCEQHLAPNQLWTQLQSISG
jgi:hypothetical protein